MTAPKPFSPETLAERWDCSAETVRRMYHHGELVGFRLGKLIRIPANEVERYECQITESSCTEGSSPSPTTTQTKSPQTTDPAAFGSRLVRMTEGSRRLALVKSGASGQPRQASE